MNSQISIFAHVSRQVLAGSLVIAALLAPRVAAAQDDTAANPNATPTPPDQPTSLKVTPGVDRSRWSLNFTPVLVMERNYDLGYGVDPELKYTLDRGGVRLSAGLRVGGYYAKNEFGITAMPTIRLMVPVGPVEPYVSFGMGYGVLTKTHYADVATMSRIGIVFRISESFGIGVEGTVQKIDGSDWAFPSFGSALAINF